MKITLESTDRIVEFSAAGGGTVSARVWQGKTERGVEVFAIIPRIAVHKAEEQAQFEQELVEVPVVHASTRAVEAFDARLVL